MHKEPVSAYHKGVDNFKKELLQSTLVAHSGNRTHAARSLGLQRTYLLRLMRDLEVRVPIPQRMRREDTNGE
jgi:DNA-binding NtrC family response regulator